MKDLSKLTIKELCNIRDAFDLLDEYCITVDSDALSRIMDEIDYKIIGEKKWSQILEYMKRSMEMEQK